MDACDEERTKSYAYTRRELKKKDQNTFQEKMTELVRIKEELKNAKDSTTQLWLGSRPLTDELEILQSTIAIAKDRTSVSNALISERESQLEATNMSIKSKMEEERKGKKLSDEITEDYEATYKELEMIKRDINEERRARLKLKQVLRMRRQTLRALQATLQAVEVESEAFRASTSEAIGHIKNSGTDNSTVQLTQEEYYALRESATDETALGEWRISLFKKQKLAAEVSRDLCLKRLKEINKNEENEEEINEDENIIKGVEEQQSPIRRSSLPKVRDKATNELNQDLQKQRRRSRRSNIKKNKKVRKKKKPSILIQIRIFLERSILRLFR